MRLVRLTVVVVFVGVGVVAGAWCLVLVSVLGALNCQKRDLHLKNHKSHETS